MNKFNFPRYEILGAGVHAATKAQALDAIDDAIQHKRGLMIGVVNAAKIVNMRKDPELSNDVNGSDLVLADGMSVVLASKVLRSPLPERVTGIDLMMGILKRGDRKNYRVYCLGATEEVSNVVVQKIRKLFPGIQIIGSRNGYFSTEDELGIIDDIAKCEVDVLLVAITSPKKERLMAKWSSKLQTTVVHGVGGSFDVLAGQVKRAPKLWQKLGFEWLYRVIQEPGRLWKRYLITNAVFIGMLVAAVTKRLLHNSST